MELGGEMSKPYRTVMKIIQRLKASDRQRRQKNK